MNTINVGIIGVGTVGSGVMKLLNDNMEVIEKRLGARLHIKQVADKEPDRERVIKIPDSLMTTDPWEIIQDESVPIVVELIGGTTVAKELILEAIDRGKHVVTANKALLALYGEEIFSAAAKRGVDIGFEASVGGGIPILRAIREGYVANRILSIYGIINGTSNYILTKMTEEGRRFDEVLKAAQKKGYAEADPTLDINGGDAAHKLAIAVTLSFGTGIRLEDIYTEGIGNITPLDINFADEFGYKIKLLAVAKARNDGIEGIEVRVHPTLVEKGTPLANVSGVYNAIYIVGDALGPNMLYGMGAGMMPTASAVVGDLVEIARNIIYKTSRVVPPRSYQDSYITRLPIIPITHIVTRYYIRFQVVDKPGVLGQIAGILGKYNISIASVIQKERKIGGDVPVVIMTHEARESDLIRSLEEIDRLPVIKGRSVFIRIEDI